MSTSNQTEVYESTDLGDRAVTDKIIRLNVSLASFITCWTPVNIILLVCFAHCCPVRNSFNMFALLICTADVMTCAIWGPLSLVGILKPSLINASFCQAKIFIRTVTFSVTLVASVQVGCLRFVSAVSMAWFKTFLQTRMIISSSLIMSSIVMALCLPTIAINSKSMLVCAQRPLTSPPFHSYWKLPVGVTIVALIAVIICYISLISIVCYKNMGFKTLPQNHKTTLVTLRVGVFVTVNYFAFYFIPFIWALFASASDTSPKLEFKLAETKTLIVALQSCMNSLLFTLPSQRFRETLRAFLSGGHINDLEQSQHTGDVNMECGRVLPVNTVHPVPSTARENHTTNTD